MNSIKIFKIQIYRKQIITSFSILYACLSLSLNSCSNKPLETETQYVPQPTQAHSIAFDQNDQNAGVLEADEHGVYVTQGWLNEYDSLASNYGIMTGAKSGDRYNVAPVICPKGKYRGRECFLVPYSMSNQKTDMKQLQRNGKLIQRTP